MKSFKFLILLGFLALALCPAASADPIAQRFTGKLVVPPEAGTKQSYLTGDFQIVMKKETRIVSPSDKVSESELLAHKGQVVTVEALYVPAQKADPSEQAPIGPDGLVDHPAYYRVISIRAVKP